MYKKITHTIVEEHFDHPIGGQIKKTIERSRVPTTEIFDEDEFKLEVANFFKNYKENLINIADASNGTEEELVNALESSLINIENFLTIFKKFYVTPPAERIGISLRLFPVLLVGAINQLKAGLDPAFWTNRISGQVVNDISAVLSALNQGAWNYNSVNSVWSDVVSNLILKIKAKIKKDAAQDQTATRMINSKLSDFEKILVDGIIKQFPERFTRKATDSYSHSDIM
jgi:hypothetical protein